MLLAAYDADRSGSIDRAAEVVGLPCAVWSELDAKVRALHHEPLASIYGFDPGYVWVGQPLGFTDAARQPGMSALRGCGLAGGGGPVAPTEVAEAILRVPVASEAWAAQVQRVLLTAFDRNGSGDLDNRAELDAMDCRVWRTLDSAVRQQWQGTGLAWLYGFEPQAIWLGGTLGFDAPLRVPALAAIEACGLRR
ncbi:MAG TPA: hypothetical protein PKA64_26260 [Myxococcota bacterium]|nr:hypothetical protein [Myxococcota bacterium]